MGNRAWRFVMGLALAAVGCSGSASESAPSCANFAACGGDLVGTWKVTATCVTVDNAALMKSCAGATATYALDTQGTVAFAADGTYRNNITAATHVHLTVPPSCVMQGATCATAESSLMTTYGAAHCTGDATTGCSCDAEGTQTDADVGHYTVTGHQLMQTSDRPGAKQDDPADFCVKDDRLTVHVSAVSLDAIYAADKQ